MIRVLPWALFATLLGCGGESVTEVFACYSVDPGLAASSGDVRICAQTDDGSRVLFGCDDAPVGVLGSSVISQGFVQSRAEGVLLKFEGDVPVPGGVTTTIAQEALVPFQEGRIVDVSLRIENACVAVGCGAGETCVGGECVPLTVQVHCLGDHGDPPVPGCTDPRVTRGCADL